MNINTLTCMYAIVDPAGMVRGNGESPYLWGGDGAAECAYDQLAFLREGFRDEDTGELMISPDPDAAEYRVVRISVNCVRDGYPSAIEQAMEDSRQMIADIRAARQADLDREQRNRESTSWFVRMRQRFDDWVQTRAI